MNRIRSFAIITILASTSALSAVPAYNVIILQPIGYGDTIARGIADNQQVGYSTGDPNDNALLWLGSASSVIDLNPTGYHDTALYGTDGIHQIGAGFADSDGQSHALLWSNSAGSFIDLNPAGCSNSFGYGIGGGQAVGIASHASPDNAAHAILWDFSGHMTDLHPAGFVESWAYGTDGAHQVGLGIISTTNGPTDHALVWNGSAPSVTDINPPGYSGSVAHGVSGDQVVGATTNDAALWIGSDYSFVSLGAGEALATNGIEQVGDRFDHAVLWAGTSATLLDLHQFLPAGFARSYAYGIDQDGAIVGEADGPNGAEAVMWIPVVPEPEALILVAGIAIFTHNSRKRIS